MAEYLLKMEDELHRALKIIAAEQGTTLKEIMLNALREYLKRKGKSKA